MSRPLLGHVKELRRDIHYQDPPSLNLGVFLKNLPGLDVQVEVIVVDGFKELCG